jgi:hypothetical protein
MERLQLHRNPDFFFVLKWLNVFLARIDDMDLFGPFIKMNVFLARIEDMDRISDMDLFKGVM